MYNGFQKEMVEWRDKSDGKYCFSFICFSCTLSQREETLPHLLNQIILNTKHSKNSIAE